MASKSPSRTGGCSCGEPACPDSRCLGLEAFERPRFFAGQLLTEQELSAEQAYVQAKNRLHNLHLHGWGVVCGLEVTCHTCDGWVRVHPGYAIDSCGNDVIVPCPHDLDVIGAIEACKAERRKKDCYCPPTRDCSGEGEEHWCISLSYQEKEARPQATLHEQAGGCGCRGKSSCGCGCGGDGGGGGHGGGHGHGAGGCGCQKSAAGGAKPGAGKVPYACEPTRIVESYRLEVCQSDGESCLTKKSLGEQQWIDKLTACFTGLRRSLGKMPLAGTVRLGSVTMQDAGVNVAGPGTPPPPPAQIHRDTCDLRDFLVELLEKSPGNLHCSLLARLREIECRAPEPNDTLDSYWRVARAPAQDLLGILLIYLKDCLCHALLPPCAPCCPGEEPLILACVTVRDGEIEDICNYDCRRWAGAFPPSMFGVYLGPIWPLLAKLIGVFCCGDVFERLLGTVERRSWAQQAAQYVLGDDLANPRFAVAEAARLWRDGQAEPAPLDQRVDAVAISGYVGLTGDEAVARAGEAQVEMRVVEVEQVTTARRWAALRTVRPGDRLIAYAERGRVVGFARDGSAEAALVEQGAELAELRGELRALAAAVHGKGSATKRPATKGPAGDDKAR